MRHIWWRRAMVPLVAAGALVGAIMTVGGGSEPATRALAIADATTQSARMPTSDQIGPLRTATDVGIPAKQVTAIKEAVQARTSIPDGSDLYLASENDIAVPGVTDQTLKTYDFAYAPPKADTITNVTTVHVISQSDGSLLVNVRPPVSGLDASANGDGAPTTKTVTTYDLVIDSDSAITSASTSPVAMSAEMQTEGQPITSSDGSSTSSPKLSAASAGRVPLSAQLTQVVTWWCIASLSAPRLVVFYVLVAIQEDSGACDLPGLTVDSIYLDANFVNQASHVFLGYRVGSLYGWVYNNATSYRCPPEGVYGYYWGRQDAVNTAPGFNNIDLHQNWILPPDPKPPVYFGGYCLATV